MIRVLLIEDSRADARLVQLDLEGSGEDNFEIQLAERLEDALRRIESEGADVILTDLNLPDSKGLNSFRKLREAAPHLPIVLLTGESDENLAVQMVKEGAEDYIVKGEVKGKYLSRAILYAIERRSMREKLEEQNRKLERMLQIDPLTGLFSRRHILSHLDDEIARHNRYGNELALIMLDIDDFKHINDDYGHQAGDEALKAAAEYIKNNIREVDKAARYGGDEFIILLPNSDLGAAEEVCRKLSEKTVTLETEDGLKIELSLSIGAADARGITTSTKLIDAADTAMLSAKRSGKGHYHLYDESGFEEEEENGIDQLKSVKSSIREVLCQLLGATLNEVERERDVINSTSEMMQLLIDYSGLEDRISRHDMRTLRNVVQIFRFIDLNVSEEILENDYHRLSEAQRRVLAERFVYNIGLLERVRFLFRETEVLSSMKEWYNGEGFPKGLRGEEIPFLARLLAVLFDAAAGLRQAEDAGKPDGGRVADRLEKESGRRFDPEAVELIISGIRSFAADYADSNAGDILVVDDDRINRKILSGLLEKSGYPVTATADLGDFRKHLHERDWKAVIIDIMLPDGNGLDVLSEAVKLDPRPIICIESSCFDGETIARAEAEGADIFLIKPIKIRLLLRCLGMYTVSGCRGRGKMPVISGLSSVSELR